MSSTLCADAPSPKKKKWGGRHPLLKIFFFFRGEGAFVHRLNEFKPIRGTHAHETSTAPSLHLHSMREGGGAFSILTEKGSHILDCNNCE